MAQVSQNPGFECMHAFDWPEQTLKTYIQYSTYFACNNDLCSAVLINLLGKYSSAFCHIWALKRHLRRVTSAKGTQKFEFYMLAFDWLDKQTKLGAIFSLREWLVQSYGARLFGNCVKFQPWRRQLGNMFLTTPYF